MLSTRKLESTMALSLAKGPVRFAEDIVSEALAEKYRNSLKDPDKGKKRGRRIRKQAKQIVQKRPQWWINLNKGLLAEFIIFLISQGFDFFTNCWVLAQVYQVLDKAKFYKSYRNVTALNFTSPGICRSGDDWEQEEIDLKVKHFDDVVIVYCLFIALTSMFITLQLMSWLYTLYLSMEKRELGKKGRETLVMMKLVFLAAASLLEDIPLSSLTAELFAVQQGTRGITCWLCRVSNSCPDSKTLLNLLDSSQQVLVLNVCAIFVTSLWKGISSFYRWSRIPNCEAFFIRACTSLFVGGLFVIIILTPAMTVLTYRYYSLPGVTGGLVKDLIDKVYIIGVLFWIAVLAVVCCCPLLFIIRVVDK